MMCKTDAPDFAGVMGKHVMTNLSSISSFATQLSPRAQMNARISSAASAGEISATDKTALTTALDSIDSTLSSAGTASGSGTSMKDRIDSLIEQQVSKGTLTDDQAAELKTLFAQGAPGNGPPPGGNDQSASSDGVDVLSGAQGPGGPRGPGGPPPPPPSDSDSDSDTDTASDSSSSATTNSTSSASDQLDSLIAFLENLRQSISASGTYGSTASSNDSSTSLVFSGVA